MPKQILKLEQFHGGLSTNSDPRDVADNELTAATDVMVDELGKIRTMGGTTAHDAGSSTAVDIEPGYGLFQFSHDRVDGHLGEHLAEGDFTTHANWDVNSELTNVTDNTGKLYFKYGSGELQGTVTQTYGDRLEAGIGGITYAFTYTVAVTTAPNFFTLAITSFPAATTSLPFTAGTHTVTFTSHANAATTNFVITATDDVGGTTDQGEFSIDNVSLVIYDAAETGDDYLALADDESADPAVYIYSKNRDAWSESQTVTMGTTNDFAPCFYFADGALRISDGNFGANNTNQWYGYIDRYQFGDGVTGVDTGDFNNGKIYDQWFSGDATLTALPLQSVGTTNNPDIDYPVALYFDPGSVVETGTAYYQNLSSSGNTRLKDRFILCEIDFDSTDDSLTFSNNTDVNIENFVAEGDYISIAAAADGDNNNVFQVDSIDAGDPNKIFVTGSIHSNDTQNDVISITNLSRCEWWDNEKQYLEFGMTTLYDDNQQESKINIFGTLFDTDAACFTTLPSDWGNPKIGARVFTSSSNTFGTTYPRVTGFNIYVRRASNRSGSGDFFRFIEISIKDGERVVEISDDFTMWLNALHGGDAVISTTGTTEWGQDTSNGGTNPFPSLMTYTANANVPNSDTIVNVDAFKTAVVTNRMAYIGNVKQDSIVYGDRMMKSVVNQFDKFPDDRTIDVSINDGDEIIKLEEFADRILCFKKKKMYLINVSQELEILEDIFMYKGISHPAATCKTDFGIAWINRLGCYLYDGQKVINLLEKQGRQIIKESEWLTFTTNDTIPSAYKPMIGYIPKKRQLLVVDDNTATGTGKTFLYDLVTQSWVKGADATITSADLTNFVTDWNGDLVHAHTNGTVLKWDDASDGDSTQFNITTKDIDFGQPSQRKKIYKVYISYKGDGSNAVAGFGVNGITPATAFASNTFASVGTNDWVRKELGFTDSSVVNNIYSFRVAVTDSGSALASDFEINDISIVYRLKGIK